MKFNFLLAACCLLFTTGAFSQNLVTDPSFENFTPCPQGPSEFDNLVDWRNPYNNVVGDTCSTSDLYNTCSPNPFGFGGVGVPSNLLGWQAARTGSGYTGIIVYEGVALNGCTSVGGSGWREYAEGILTSPLSAGQTYCVSFYTSLANNVKFGSDDIGVYFSNTQIAINCTSVGASSVLPYTPQLSYTGAAITDTANWVLLSWSYTATGGERYITIGNFKNDANTSYVCANAGSINPYAYYYLEDVSVTPGACCITAINPVDVLCVADAPVTLNGGTSGGTWSGTGITNASAGTFNPATAGVGTHTVTYSLNCGSSASTTITVDACAMSVCLESNGTLTASDGTGPYTWEHTSQVQDCSTCFPATPPLIAACSVPPGCATTTSGFASFGGTGATTTVAPSAYPVRVTDAHNNTLTITNAGSLSSCSSTCALTLSSSSVGATCGTANGSATVNVTVGTGPFTYLWSPGGATTSSISGINGGTYTVAVTSEGGSCSDNATVVVSSSAAVTLSTTSSHTTCGNTNGTVTTSTTAGTGPFTYLWSPGGATTASVSGLASGSYSVTVTGAGGCTANGSATVNASTALTVTPSATNANCNQNNGSASVSVTGGSGSYTYSWSNGGTTNAISNVATGNFDITVDDGQGCTSTQTIYVPQNTSLTGSVTGTIVSCGSSNDGTIDLSVSGGTGPYTYAWTPGGATTQDLTGLTAGAYNVTVTDNAGCQFLTSYDVESENAMVIDSVVEHETCKGYHDGSIDLTVSGGTGPYTYAWSSGGFTTQDVSGLFGGAYSVTVTDQGSGCSSVLNFVVQDGYNFPVSISQAGDTLTATSSPNYQWYHNGDLIQGATNQTYVITEGGYFYCIVGSQNCEFSSNTIETSCICTGIGITENTVFEGVAVFPNPAQDLLNVHILLKNPDAAQAKLHDMAGRIVWKQENKNKSYFFEWKIPVTDLAQGIYFVEVIAGGEAEYVKVAIEK